MKRLKYFSIILVALTIIFGCKKKKEEKIIGTWNLVTMSTSDANKTIWSFYDGNMLIINDNDSTGTIISSDTAYYEIKERFFKYFVEISNLSEVEDGSYQIEKLNNSALILQCSSPNYIRREFYK